MNRLSRFIASIAGDPAAEQPFESGHMWWFSKGSLNKPVIFVRADDGWFGVFMDKGEWATPDDPRQADFSLQRGFGYTWLQPIGPDSEIMVSQKLGWATANESSGRGSYALVADNRWELVYNDEVVVLEHPEPPPLEPPPDLPEVPPPFPGFSRPPEPITLPSGVRKDLAFLTGIIPLKEGIVRTTWAYGYYITVDREKGTITLRGETIEVYSGEDAAALLVAWDQRGKT
jgi:hypothetical protein